MQAKQVEESPFFIGKRKSGTRVWHEFIKRLVMKQKKTAIVVTSLHEKLFDPQAIRTS
jgi:hypothetical protein